MPAALETKILLAGNQRNRLYTLGSAVDDEICLGIAALEQSQTLYIVVGLG